MLGRTVDEVSGELDRYLVSVQTYVNLYGISLTKATHVSLREEPIGKEGQKDKLG